MLDPSPNEEREMGPRKIIALVAVLALIFVACGDDDSPVLTSGAEAAVEDAETTTSSGGVITTIEQVSTEVVAVYAVVDTGQTACYDEAGSVITCPAVGEEFFGQDGSYSTSEPSYIDNGDGTVTDTVTGLMWQQDPGDKVSYAEAVEGAEAFELAGYDDWRLPTIKELYSLILFSGTDPSGCQTDVCDVMPFIDDVFAFAYGDTDAGERLIDSQWATSTLYSGLTMGGDVTMFGVNFADGRIKGYGLSDPRTGEDKGFFAVYVRGNEAYGENDLVDNADGTVSDLATHLMWQQSDSVDGMEWAASLEYCETLDAGGYADWRLPDVKELQSIVDYSRSPQATSSAAIDPVFSTTSITDEGGSTDFGSYWSSTTHASITSGRAAAYVAFGEALGWMQSPQGDYTLMDVHGAGAQRSDPKTGDASDYPYGNGPQGDVIRIENLVRCVRVGDAEVMTGGFSEAAASQQPIDLGTSAPGGGPLAEAAAELGVMEEALVVALGDPSLGPPDLEQAAQTLGISVEELQAVLLPLPEQG
jgi:hypothetical protein